MIRARIFNICQFYNNPRTGEPIIDREAEEKIFSALNRYASLKEWSYIIHDEDNYTQDEVDNNIHQLKEEYWKTEGVHDEAGQETYISENQWVFLGQPKPKHIHIVIRTKSAIDVEMVAKWLGIPSQYIQLPKGKSAFLDCVQYLTHEDERQQVKGKTLYSDDKVVSNFEWRAALTKRNESLVKYHRDHVTDIERWIYEINHGTMTLQDCFMEDPILYGQNEATLVRNRKIYLQMQPLPKNRINIYVGGKRKNGTSGGLGKSLASEAIARSLIHQIPGCEEWPDEKIFFHVGANNVTFEGYDGEPVIIWDDCKAYTLLNKLGNRENIYNIFDTHPKRIRQNVKNSFVNLTNRYNIINSVESPEEFLNGLAGEYTNRNGELIIADDKSQIRRRIVITMWLREEDFDISFNKGFFDDGGDFDAYNEYKCIVGNFQKVRANLEDKTARTIEERMVRQIPEKVKEYESNHTDESRKMVVEDFALYGSIPEQLTFEQVLNSKVEDEGGFMEVDDSEPLPFD